MIVSSQVVLKKCACCCVFLINKQQSFRQSIIQKKKQIMTDLSGNLLAQGGPWWEYPSFLRFETHLYSRQPPFKTMLCIARTTSSYPIVP